MREMGYKVSSRQGNVLDGASILGDTNQIWEQNIIISP